MQQEEIRINDKFVSVIRVDQNAEKPDIPVAKLRSQSTNIFLKKLYEKYSQNQTGMTPRNCRYIERIDSNKTIIVIEEPPSFRTLFFSTETIRNHVMALTKEKIFKYEINMADYEKDTCQFNLALPYIVFTMIFNGPRLDILFGAVRPKPIISISDNLFVPPFLNINDACQVCLGDQVSDSQNIILAIDKLLLRFWSSQFNRDYNSNFVKYSAVPILGNLFDWQYQSQIDPMFIYKAEWIPMDLSCLTFITSIKATYAPHKVKALTYTELYNIFDIKQKYIHKKIDVKKPPLLTDVSNGINLLKTKDEPATILYVGDPIQFKTKTFYVETFLGHDAVGPAEYIRFIGEDNKSISMKLTKRTRSFLLKQRKKLLFEETVTLSNGVVITAGDILILEDRMFKPIYKKIIYIRKSSEGLMELRAADQYLMADNLPKNAKILDLQNIEVDGLKLKEGEIYDVCNRQVSNSLVLHLIIKAIFKEIAIVQSNKLVAMFKPLSGGGPDFGINLNDSNCIFKELNIENLPDVIYIGANILKNQSTGKIFKMNNTICYNYGIISIGDNTFETACKTILKEDAFTIRSTSLDILFEVGDEVVVANWENPKDMLKVKKIIGITKNSEKKTIEFNLVDKNNNNSTATYVEKNIINIGTVRRIVREYKGIKRGSKIVAKNNLNGFLKGSVNIIIGFLDDTGTPEPLVYCSNCLTLWFSDVIENFDIIERDSKTWNELNHNPIDIARIEMQPGDIVQCSGGYRMLGGYALFRTSSYDLNLTAVILKNNMNFGDYYNLDKQFLSEMKFHAILNPRVNNSKEEIYPCIPNLHGGYYTTPQLIANVPNSANGPFFQPGKGRLFNVSDSNK